VTKILKFKEIKEKLNVGTNKALEIINSEGFPRVKYTRIIMAPEHLVDKWIEENAKKGA